MSRRSDRLRRCATLDATGLAVRTLLKTRVDALVEARPHATLLSLRIMAALPLREAHDVAAAVGVTEGRASKELTRLWSAGLVMSGRSRKAGHHIEWGLTKAGAEIFNGRAGA